MGWESLIFKLREKSCIGEVHTGSSGLYSAVMTNNETVLVIGMITSIFETFLAQTQLKSLLDSRSELDSVRLCI